MTTAHRPEAIRRFDDGKDRWEMSTVGPPARLAGIVTSYTAYAEHTGSFSARRELASTTGVLLFNLGEPLELVGADGACIRLRGGEAFAAGVADGTSISRSTGSQAGIHVSMPLETLAATVGAPAAEIANRVVALDDLLGSSARVLGERLRGAADAQARFRALDAFLEARLASAAAIDTEIVWARRQLEADVPPRIDAVARRIGWSRKHFAARFRAAVGVTPDVYRQLARFERFWRTIQAQPDESLACLAAGAGYHDQAHLSRDVRAFSAMTPGELRRRLIPGNGGVRDD